MNKQPAEHKYHAFISYSTGADGKLAPGIQAALERFGKPWYSRSSVRVFRDQTDLALTPDLTHEIQNALERSECFIFLASPDAAHSAWVEKEIQFWVQHRSPNRLLIVLTGGKLHWGTDDFDWTESTALPGSLKGFFRSQPLWADLSWAKNNSEQSLQNPRFLVEIARLVAAIRGESLTDTLNRAARQHQKAMRLLRATVAALAVLAVAALGVASVSFQAKRTADAAGAAIKAQLDAAQKRLDEETEAQRRKKEQQANEAASAELASKAASVFSEDRELSMILALKAVDIAPTREAEDALRRTLLEFTPPLVLHAHSGAVYSVQFSSDGKRVLTSSADGTVRLWDPVTGTNILMLQVIADMRSQDVASGILSQDATRILTLARPATLAVGYWQSSSEPKLYDATTGNLLTTISDRFVVNATLSPDNLQIATAGFDGKARILDARTGKIRFDLAKHTQRVTSVNFSFNSNSVVTASWDGTARVSEANTGQELVVLNLPKGNRADFACFSPDGKRVLALCDERQELLVWDWANRPGDPVAVFTGHDRAIQDLAFSKDGQWLATASVDQTARVWDITTGKSRHILSGHEGFVNGVDFSPDGKWVVTVSGDKTALIWNAATGENLMQLGWNFFPRTCVAFSPDGKRIITGTTEGQLPIYTYDILGPAEELRRLARGRIHRELTEAERNKYLSDSRNE